MSTLYYGSGTAQFPGVLLTRVQLMGPYQRVNVYNGPDYLYTIHRLSVRGIFNPEVNAYDFLGGRPAAIAPGTILTGIVASIASTGRGNTVDAGVLGPIAAAAAAGGASGGPAQSRGSFAPATDAAVRHLLMQPRQQLLYAVGPAATLVSPSVVDNGTGTLVVPPHDACNGPVPLACNVVQISGTKTFLVDYSIETYVNEFQLFASRPSVMLSNRFERRQEWDQDYYTTIVTTGLAKFRTDRLAVLGAVPDDFRSYLFMPRPPGFKRSLGYCVATPDGDGVQYQIVDKELAVSIVPPGVTRIECFQTTGAAARNLEALGFAGIKALPGLLTAPSLPKVSSDPIAAAAATANAAIDAYNHTLGKIGTVISALIDAIPRTGVDAVARVWGRQNVQRKVLEDVAVQLVLARLQSAINPIARFLAGTKMVLSHDVGGTFVECAGHVETALTGGVLEFGTLLSSVPDVGSTFPIDDSSPSVGQRDAGRILNADTSGARDGDGMDLPFGALPSDPRGPVNSRGTYLERLVAAALLNPTSNNPVFRVNPVPTAPVLGGLPVARAATA